MPVTVLTGFLGSGKTTLLNRILTEYHGKRIAVIENEFGEIGIDDALVLDSEEEIFEMNNGCICCTVRGDLIRILGALMRRRDRFDHILIETTGLADPAPVAQTFFVDDEIRDQLRLDAIITVVDAAHVLDHLDEVKPEGVENESVEQVAFADRMILNKTDLVTPAHLETVERRLRGINHGAEIIHAQNAKIDLDRILDVGAFDLQRVLSDDPAFLTDTDHQHDLTVTSVGFQIDGDLDVEKLNAWLGELLSTRGVDIFRSKGILAIDGQTRQHVFQGVHMLFDGTDGRPWGADERRTNRLVFIGRNLDRGARSVDPGPSSGTGGRCREPRSTALVGLHGQPQVGEVPYAVAVGPRLQEVFEDSVHRVDRKCVHDLDVPRHCEVGDCGTQLIEQLAWREGFARLNH
ncbi:cobalamin biosynthesis protein CobW [Mycobacterium antarcticum]|nr:cobalamin biosynthesis protein CobW [Mycolicibacterium sp. TUM20985]GLP82919.1 cobalamin biosynthesis protein CobW [Mycolicibacterium sp. TUM20984]